MYMYLPTLALKTRHQPQWPSWACLLLNWDMFVPEQEVENYSTMYTPLSWIQVVKDEPSELFHLQCAYVRLHIKPSVTCIPSMCILHCTSMQNEYCECAHLILSHYPDQIERLLAMVFSDKIAEAKMQQLLTYLGKNCTNLLSRVLSKLASNTCLAGMELLRYVVVASFPIPTPSFSVSHTNVCHIYCIDIT